MTIEKIGDIQWVQCCCQRYVSTERQNTCELPLCEEHICENAELAHFVMLFLCEENGQKKELSEIGVFFSPKFATSGRQKGRLASGWVHFVKKCKNLEEQAPHGCKRQPLLSVHLINEEQCRRLFVSLAQISFKEVGGTPSTPTQTELEGIHQGSSPCDISRAYHTHMRHIVWRRMSDLQASGDLPRLVLACMAGQLEPYHIEWDERTVRSGMEVLKLHHQTADGDGDQHANPCFIVRRLHLPPPMEAVNIVGSTDGRYVFCGDGTTINGEMNKQLPLQLMIIRDAHPIVEPHHPPVLVVHPAVVISTSGPDELASTCRALVNCVAKASPTLLTEINLPAELRMSALRCREQCWAEWTGLRMSKDGACIAMAIFFLMRGALLAVPITDHTDHRSILLPCVLAQPENTHPGQVCLLVVPPNIPICWRVQHGTGKREACVGVRARGPAGVLRQLYFTGLVI